MGWWSWHISFSVFPCPFPLRLYTISSKKTVCIFVLGSQAKLLLICSRHFDWKLRVDLLSFRFFQDFVLASAACRTQIPLLSIISLFIIIVSYNPLFISRFFLTLLQEIKLFIYVISNFCNNNLFNISLWRSHVQYFDAPAVKLQQRQLRRFWQAPWFPWWNPLEHITKTMVNGSWRNEATMLG